MITTSSSKGERANQVKNVLWFVLFLNLFVAIAKYMYGSFSGSAAMQADGIHSVFDSAGNVIGLIGIAIASRPADREHPYGHSKFETYASVLIGCMLLSAAGEIGFNAIQSIYNNSFSAQVTPVSFIVMSVTLCINIGVSYYERKQGAILKSSILKADAAHTLSDAIVSLGVIAGLVFVLMGFPIADSIMALIVTVAILSTAIGVFKQALCTLSDHARIPVKDIEDCVRKIPEVRNVHKVRTRGSEDEIYVDLHILVDPTMTVKSAHDLANQVEYEITNSFEGVSEVLVHVEPNDGHIDR